MQYFIRWYPLFFATFFILTIVVLRGLLLKQKTKLPKYLMFSLFKKQDFSLGVFLQIFNSCFLGIIIVSYSFQLDIYRYTYSIKFLETPWIYFIGVAFTLFFWILAWIAQGSMGGSWRIGVDKSHQNVLKTDGLFKWVRHPILSSLGGMLMGAFLLIPSVAMLLSLIISSIGRRLVARDEERFLIERHGNRYIDYMKKTGRFFPKW